MSQRLQPHVVEAATLFASGSHHERLDGAGGDAYGGGGCESGGERGGERGGGRGRGGAVSARRVLDVLSFCASDGIPKALRLLWLHSVWLY